MEVDAVTTRNVALSQDQYKVVESLVASGRYQNASEVLREALGLLERQQAEYPNRIVALRAATDTGWADLAAGRYVDIDDEDLDDVVKRLGARSEARGRTAG